MESLAKELSGLSLNKAPILTTEADSPWYIYCDTESGLEHVRSLLKSSDSSTPTIFLDCEGRDLGRIDGKLGLVQLVEP